MLAEARELLSADGSESLLPPTPPRAPESDDADLEVGDDDDVTCINCGAMQMPTQPDENGMTIDMV